MAADHQHPDPLDSGVPSVVRRVGMGVREYFATLRLFSGNVRLYLVGSFLMGVNFQVFMLLLNLYLKELGYLEANIGLVGSSRAVGMTLMAIPAAIVISRIRLKPVLMITIVLFSIFSIGIVTSTGLNALLAFSLVSGMCFAFYRVAAGPFFMRNSTRKERTHIFSFQFGMMILAGMVGSLAAGNLAAFLGERMGAMTDGYRYTLIAGALVSMLSMLPFALIRSEKPSSEERGITFSVAQFKRRGKFYFMIVLVNLLIGLGAGLVIPFLNLYFRDRFGAPPDDIGLYYFFVQCAMLVGSLSGPMLVKKFGLVRTIVVTQLSSIPFLLALAYSFNLNLSVAAFVIRGGLMNLGWPIVVNLGMELSEKKEQGLVNALLMIAWTSSWMIATAVGGTLIERFGYTFSMNITVSLYVVSSTVFFLYFRGVETRRGGKWELIEKDKHE